MPSRRHSHAAHDEIDVSDFVAFADERFASAEISYSRCLLSPGKRIIDSRAIRLEWIAKADSLQPGTRHFRRDGVSSWHPDFGNRIRDRVRLCGNHRFHAPADGAHLCASWRGCLEAWSFARKTCGALQLRNECAWAGVVKGRPIAHQPWELRSGSAIADQGRRR